MGPIRLFVSVVLLYACISKVQCESRRLVYMFTVFTKPKGSGGPVFSAVGLYDDRRISHYTDERIWKRDDENAEFWRHTNEPHRSRDWFINQVNTLAECQSNRCDGLHTLQWRIGCEVDAEGNETFTHKFGYDGKDYDFNSDGKQFEEDVNCTSKFYISIPSNAPDIYMFASEAPHDRNKLSLTCLATGFYPKHEKMKITLNGNKLQLFASTGVRPNDEKTFQMRLSVEIHRDEELGYECHVLHANHTYSTTWDGKCTNCSGSGIYFLEEAVVVFTLVLLKVLLWCIFTGSVHKKFNVNQMNSNSLTRKQSIPSESAELENSRCWWTFRSRRFCRFSTTVELKISLPKFTRFFRENSSRGYKIRI